MNIDAASASVRRRFASSSVADMVMVAIMISMLLISVVRLAAAATDLPSALSASRKAAAAGRKPSRTLADYLKKKRVFKSWWGGRHVPKMKGGDYLAVISQADVRRTLGPVLGIVIERENSKGIRIRRVIVPKNQDALVGGKAATKYRTAEGKRILDKWGTVAYAAARFTTVLLEERDYGPILNDEQFTKLKSATKLTKRATSLSIGAPMRRGSGAWILYSHRKKPTKAAREFLLIPAEVDPKGVTQ